MSDEGTQKKKDVVDTSPSSLKARAQSAFLHLLQGVNISSAVIPGQMFSFALLGTLGGDAAAAGAFSSTLQSIQSLLTIITGPLIGQLSDAYGRKPTLLATTLFAVLCRAQMLRHIKSKSSLVLARVGGSLGTAWTSIVIAAALGDMAKGDQAKRQKFTSTDMAMRGVGIMVGPLLGGYLATNYSNRAVLRASTLGALALTALVGMRFKETCAAEDRRPVNSKAFRKITGLLGFTNLYGKDRDLSVLATCFALQDFAIKTGPIFGVASNLRFGHNQATIGRWISMYGMTIIAPAFLIPAFMRRVGERGTIYAALFFSALGSGMLGASRTGRLWWLSLLGFALGNMKAAAIKAALLRRGEAVLDVGKGELSGYSSSMINMSGMLSPQIHAATFSFFSDKARAGRFYWPGAPWLNCSIVNMLCMAVFGLTSSKAAAYLT